MEELFQTIQTVKKNNSRGEWMLVGNLESILQIIIIILLSSMFHLIWLCIAQFAMNSTLRKLNLITNLSILLVVSTVGTLSLLLFLAMGISLLTSIAISIIFAIVVYLFSIIVFSNRHKILWMMALRNISRKKRNTALMIAGLLIGSAIISSSLIVGDSLDSTIKGEAYSVLGETDLRIYGYDRASGLSKEMNETLLRDFKGTLENNSMISENMDGYAIGRQMDVSSFNSNTNRGEPSTSWFSFDPQMFELGNWEKLGGSNGFSYLDIENAEKNSGEELFVINKILADELEVNEGDLIEISFNSYDAIGQSKKIKQDILVWKIVEMAGSSMVAGTSEPCIFSTLNTAQEIQLKQNLVNIVDISAKGGVENSLESEDILYSKLKSKFNDEITADDVGFLIVPEPTQSAISIAITSGNSRLSSELVEDITDFVFEKAPNASVSETLQSPLLQVNYSGLNLTGIVGNNIESIHYSNGIEWFVSTSGVSTLNVSTGEWSSWSIPNEGVLNDFTLLNGEFAYVAHENGLVKIESDGEINEIILPTNDLGSEITGVTSIDNNLIALRIYDSDTKLELLVENNETWFEYDLYTADNNQEIMKTSLFSDKSNVIIQLQDLFSSKTCNFLIADLVPISIESETNCEWSNNQLSQSELVSIGGLIWEINSNGINMVSTGVNLSENYGLPDTKIVGAGCNGVWLDGEAYVWNWNGTDFAESDLQIPVNAFDSSDFIEPICVFEDRGYFPSNVGVLSAELRENITKFSGRLPLIRTIEGFNQIPLLVMGFNGSSQLAEVSPKEGEIQLTSWASATIGIETGEELTILGLIPAAMGSLEGEKYDFTSQIPNIPSEPGQPTFDQLLFGIVNISDAESLSASTKSERSSLIFSGGELLNNTSFEIFLEDVETFLDQKSNSNLYDAKVHRSKKDIIEQSELASESIANFFLVFGSFTIVAGMLLVVNIFVMLAEERKSDMGMSRALGLQRSDIRALFVMEGSALSLLASAVGSIFGLFIAYVISTAFMIVFQSVGAKFVFDWTWDSLLAGFSFGFLITWISVWLTSMRNSRLNVVAAMRKIPTRIRGSLPWWTILLSLFLFGGSIFFALLVFLLPEDNPFRHFSWLTAGYLFVFSLIPPLSFLLPMILPKSFEIGGAKFTSDSLSPRILIIGSAILLLLWTILPEWIDPIRAEMEPNQWSFIVIGLSSVTAGVLILTSLAPLLAQIVGRMSSITKRMGPVIPTALAYPLSSPFRTALVIGMFSLTVFSVVVMSGYSAQFESYSSSFVVDAQGEFELLGTGSRDQPLDFSKNTSEWPWNENLSESEFDAISQLSFGYLRYGQDSNISHQNEKSIRKNSSSYIIRGFDENFANHGGLPLQIWDESVAKTQKEIWDKVYHDDMYVVIDAALSFGLTSGEPENNIISVGDTIVLYNFENQAIFREVMVIGIMEEGSLWSLPGIYANEELASKVYDSKPTRILFSLPEGTALDKKIKISEDLELIFVESGMEVRIIEEDVKEFQALIFAIFAIFEAYLALGLAVGIAGLGVVTMRAVSERQHQTGILRALGYQRSMVMAGYLLELTWISLLGILNGVLVGIAFHWMLFVRFWKEEGVDFTMPWNQIIIIIIGSYFLIILSTVVPVRKAGRIQPAEALRDLT